jgi:hypothetical protein
MLTNYLTPATINRLSRRELIRLMYDFLEKFSNATPQVVDVLPDLIPNGELVIYDNELWRGLAEGESSLPACTPWPAKGYKSFIAVITDQPNGTEDHQLKVHKSNIGSGTFTKQSNTHYRIVFEDVPSSVYFYTPYQNFPQPFELLPEFMTATVNFSSSNNQCDIYLWKAFEGDDETILLHLNAMFFPPPP